jgi:hypothetical protein
MLRIRLIRHLNEMPRGSGSDTVFFLRLHRLKESFFLEANGGQQTPKISRRLSRTLACLVSVDPIIRLPIRF